MKRKQIATIDTPYEGITALDYQIEKRRLQVELLKIQQAIAKSGQRMAIVVEGRDAAGKGSTIKRFTQHMIPRHFRVVELGIPTPHESKYWFNRYQKHFPREGEIVFFDRSWYNRALIEPTMGYCTEKQYRYFMRKVLDWEHQHIEDGLLLVKFYLSVNRDNQLYRLEDRIQNPLTYWKFSENDLKARKKWEHYTQFKEQMFERTSSKRSPWVVVNANKKRESRLTTMLYLVESFCEEPFEPLTGEDVVKTHSIEVGGVSFKGLSHRQYAVLQELKEQEKDELNSN